MGRVSEWAVPLPDGETCRPSPDLTSLIGMANPMPETARPVRVVSTLDVTTPVACPNMFSKDPPLLPGFKEASVCRY